MDHTNTNCEETKNTSDEDTSKEDKHVPPATLKQLYRYVSGKYYVMLVVGIVNAFLAGATNPTRLIIMRDVLGEVSDSNYADEIADGMRDKIKWFVILALLGGTCCYIFCMMFIVIGAKISYELKWRYLKAVLSQDCAWYEAQNIEELPTQINVNMTEIENATGKTSGFILFSIGAFFAGIGISFFIGAVIACCYLLNIPYILMCGITRGRLLSKENEEIEKSYEKSGADAEQALMSIRVVKAFGQETSEIQKYINHLSQADKRIHRYSILFGLACGLIDSMIYVVQSYSLMIGGFFIAAGVTNGNVDRTYNLSDVLGSSIAIMMGAMYMGASSMNAQSLRRGLACAGSIISVIDRVPPININDETAEDIQAIDDDITFDHVSFKYEGRNKTILDDVSLCFKSGKTTALVGPSGCGKSTIIRLLERFYDPTQGQVLIGNKDLKGIKLQQYRRKIGYVGQEPCLLNESIKDNLLNANPDATDEEIIDCLKLAQAYDFVLKLPNGINTDVGGVSSKLSGGQKQRIAIARALIKKPDLLILDEATSALDSENERAVQSAIDNVKKTHVITTVVVAHRLTTIQSSDLIYVLNQGKIVEVGNHESLIKEERLYFSYFKSQEAAHLVYDKRHHENVDDKNKNDDLNSVAGAQRNAIIVEERSSLDIFKKLLPYNRPKFMVFALLIGCAVVASGLPIIAIYIMKCLFAYLGNDPSYMRTEMAKYCSIILGAGFLVFLIQAVNRYCLQILSFTMTKYIRKDLYNSMVNQPIQFYDKKENATGQLTGVLASDSRVVNGASVEVYLLIYQGLVGISSGVIVGFIYQWNLGLVILLMLPATSFCAYFQQNVLARPPPKASKYTDFERTIISDSISNYTTMLSLAHQDKFVERYYDCGSNEKPETNLKVDLWQTHWFSVAYAASNALIMGYFIPMTYVMASNIENGDDILAQFICAISGLLGSFTLSLASFNAPDFTKGKTSANKVFDMIESYQEGNPKSSAPDGLRDISSEEAKGDIEFHGIWFKYPSSRDYVLKNFTFKINSSESIGFVGESGCGKSTVTLLLLRFYEPNKGYITIGGTKITEFSIKSLRSIFGLVQQEPIIFNCSVMDNILYGKPHATVQEVKRAAELANANSFIETLKTGEDLGHSSFDIAPKESDPRYLELNDGYRIICGHKGSKMSGGQKQRIAIARALIRNPSILLLDEATSALDERTQVEVQQTLDEISKTTTSIIIAHRSSTLSNCDRIVKLYDGVIIDAMN